MQDEDVQQKDEDDSDPSHKKVYECLPTGLSGNKNIIPLRFCIYDDCGLEAHK